MLMFGGSIAVVLAIVWFLIVNCDVHVTSIAGDQRKRDTAKKFGLPALSNDRTFCCDNFERFRRSYISTLFSEYETDLGKGWHYVS